jgi:hypothetical protein
MPLDHRRDRSRRELRLLWYQASEGKETDTPTRRVPWSAPRTAASPEEPHVEHGLARLAHLLAQFWEPPVQVHGARYNEHGST